MLAAKVLMVMPRGMALAALASMASAPELAPALTVGADRSP
jgi:hypothetical protein